MLSLFSRRGQSMLWGNRGAQEFVGAKLGFIILALLSGLLDWSVWPVLIGWTVAEIALAGWGWRREVRQGFTLARSSRESLLRLGLAVPFGAVGGAVFGWSPLWLAGPVMLLTLVIGLGLYVGLNVRNLFKDMRGTASLDNMALFEGVRQMRDLEASIAALNHRLRDKPSFDARRDLTFWLAWAETYRGHRFLADRQWNKAADCYRKALKADSTNPAARAALTICHLQTAEFELALNEYRRAVAVFNGQRSGVKYDEALWHWQRNEASSEYEQSAGLLQLAALSVGRLEISDESGAVKQLLTREFTEQLELIPGRTEAELTRLMSRKGGTSLNALQLMLAGPFRAPAQPLEMLQEAVRLPLLSIQTVEEAGAA